jgi:hypothetical protein
LVVVMERGWHEWMGVIQRLWGMDFVHQLVLV